MKTFLSSSGFSWCSCISTSHDVLRETEAHFAHRTRTVVRRAPKFCHYTSSPVRKGLRNIINILSSIKKYKLAEHTLPLLSFWMPKIAFDGFHYNNYFPFWLEFDMWGALIVLMSDYLLDGLICISAWDNDTSMLLFKWGGSSVKSYSLSAL